MRTRRYRIHSTHTHTQDRREWTERDKKASPGDFPPKNTGARMQSNAAPSGENIVCLLLADGSFLALCVSFASPLFVSCVWCPSCVRVSLSCKCMRPCDALGGLTVVCCCSLWPFFHAALVVRSVFQLASWRCCCCCCCFT